MTWAFQGPRGNCEGSAPTPKPTVPIDAVYACSRRNFADDMTWPIAHQRKALRSSRLP
jgi:hypothetical protein